jgi:anti-sigma B factor antagonist
MSEPVANQLQIEIMLDGDEAVVHLSGKLVAGVSNDLYSQVRPLMSEVRRIILDLSGLDYADSMGLGSLVRLYVSARNCRTELVFVNLGKRVRALLGVTGLLSVFSTVGEQGIHMKF